MTPTFLQSHKDGAVLSVRVTPKSARSEIHGSAGGELKIFLHAPPADGQANAELVRLLSKELAVPKSRIKILSGDTSRSKRILLRGVSPEEVCPLLPT